MWSFTIIILVNPNEKKKTNIVTEIATMGVNNIENEAYDETVLKKFNQ